jgi:hypothetical protein
MTTTACIRYAPESLSGLGLLWPRCPGAPPGNKEGKIGGGTIRDRTRTMPHFSLSGYSRSRMSATLMPAAMPAARARPSNAAQTVLSQRLLVVSRIINFNSRKGGSAGQGAPGGTRRLRPMGPQPTTTGMRIALFGPCPNAGYVRSGSCGGVRTARWSHLAVESSAIGSDRAPL